MSIYMLYAPFKVYGMLRLSVKANSKVCNRPFNMAEKAYKLVVVVG